MKISVITVCYNAADHIEDCIKSVITQDYPAIEYIIIDGGSTDGTVEIVEKYLEDITHFSSEPDEGIYDAMNKGISRATGDIIGLLNADDMYAHPAVISRIASEFEEKETDTLFGDLVYFKGKDHQKIVRYFPGKGYRPDWWSRGLMPPHPTFFVRRQMYELHGGFDTSYEICADFDFMVRLFHREKSSYTYIPEVLVRMRQGGSSTSGISSTLTINKEMLKACQKYGIKTNLFKIYLKYFSKLAQLVKKPSE